MHKEEKPKRKVSKKKNNPTASNLASSTYGKVEQVELKEKNEIETETPLPATEYTDFYTEYEQCMQDNDTSDTESLYSFSSSLPGGVEEPQDLEIDEEMSNQYSFISKLEPGQKLHNKECSQLQFDEYDEE